MSAETGRSLPRYQSHKKVWALKIKEIIPPQIGDPKTKIVPVDSSYALIGVDAEYMAKHKPQPGGYYVVYEGGYKSYSPADAFEAGNTLIHELGANKSLLPEIGSVGFLRLPEVLKIIPVSKSSWWAGVQSGQYPKSYKIGPRTTGWLRSEIFYLVKTLSTSETYFNGTDTQTEVGG